MIFLDFAKAFDTVPYERLPLTAKFYGISGKLNNWLRVFLTGRKQRVAVNGSSSNWSSVLAYRRTQFCDRFYQRPTLWMTVCSTVILSLWMIMIRFSRTCCGLDSRPLANATSCQSPLTTSHHYSCKLCATLLRRESLSRNI